ncbi:MAG: V-type ATP synthase subunit B [Spirochaetia bacterium]|nr:V-type ATP synthase subunit B [Spirochaetia bacterium]
MRLSRHTYKTISSIAGQLIFVENVFSAKIGEMVKIIGPLEQKLDAEVLEIDGNIVLLQVFGNTHGLDIKNTRVIFSDSVLEVPLSKDMLGRIFTGSFYPRDLLPMFRGEKKMPISGFPINPAARARPSEFIETGLSAIDGMNTLVKGQKLPIFSCAGLPSREVAAFILEHARLSQSDKKFAVIFAALGVTYDEYSFYMDILNKLETEYMAVINLAEEPVIERLLAPRVALTAAEYLAFTEKMDVLTIITDMTNYCDALREVSTAREELPGRRGYPGYMYSDLAFLYERAGRIQNQEGSVTLLPILTMPEDDITHPIPDLTGYITEGQIVLSRQMHDTGVFPPIDVLPSLSRLMQKGIGEGRTRADHRNISNRLYRHYAEGRDLRKLEAIVGKEGMSKEDQNLLNFADAFEKEFINQQDKRRSIDETLDLSDALLQRFKLA